MMVCPSSLMLPLIRHAFELHALFISSSAALRAQRHACRRYAAAMPDERYGDMARSFDIATRCPAAAPI